MFLKSLWKLGWIKLMSKICSKKLSTELWRNALKFTKKTQINIVLGLCSRLRGALRGYSPGSDPPAPKNCQVKRTKVINKCRVSLKIHLKKSKSYLVTKKSSIRSPIKGKKRLLLGSIWEQGLVSSILLMITHYKSHSILVSMLLIGTPLLPRCTWSQLRICK